MKLVNRCNVKYGGLHYTYYTNHSAMVDKGTLLPQLQSREQTLRHYNESYKTK